LSYALNRYFVLARTGLKGRVIGYRVCFAQTYRDTPVDVEDGYFSIRSHGWRVALASANMLRDELLAADRRERRQADRIDGYDRDDLGASPDF
jgi:hypothetical protein